MTTDTGPALRVGMVLHDPQPFGGLEEYAATLAIGLQHLGHHVMVVSDTWVPDSNQYVRRMRDHGVPVTQPPRWLSDPASNWAAKERLLARVMWAMLPVIAVAAVALVLARRRPWRSAWHSATHAIRGWWMRHVIGPDRRTLLARPLLWWWRLRWRPDVLHVQGYTRNLLYAVEWAHRAKVPVVYEEHQTPDARFNWWDRFHESVNKAHRVIAVSEESARALREVCGVTRPIAVRSPLLPDPRAAGWTPLSVARGAEAPVRITTVARLVVAKGLDYLLEAAARLRVTYPTAEFRVYGDGPLRDQLLEQAARLGLDGPRIFVGAFTRREDLTAILQDTDIFVMSSILEGQPLGLVEAMAHGCAIVTTAVGGIPELIDDGTNGLLCPPRDADALVERIGLLMERPDMRHRLGVAARRTYEQGPYQPSAVCAHFETIYGDVLRQAKAALG